MTWGSSGTFIISWSQTEIDGLESAPMEALCVGAAWSWRGDAIRVDGPAGLTPLEPTQGGDAWRRKAAGMVCRLVGRALEEDLRSGSDVASRSAGSILTGDNFQVTDGACTYTVTLIDAGTGKPPLLMFLDTAPPRNSDLWVLQTTLARRPARIDGPDSAGVICFTEGTRIATPHGNVAVESLAPGDRILTKDNGPQPIEWIGSRHMTGARLFAMPRLRPVRFRTGALGIERPDQELLVSPDHRMLISGAVARELFNTTEVLVAARDLINGRRIVVDAQARAVTYVHLLLPVHSVVWANGVPTESFHPANTAFDSIDDTDRRALLDRLPEVQDDPFTYGDFARRNLSSSEAAILLQAA